VKINIIEPHGEIFWVPFFHKDEGPTWAGAVEAIPGGELDRFSGVTSGREVVELVKELFAEYFPWEQSWFEKAELADENGWLTGSITPTVRHPVGTLPSGRAVIGIGDTVISFDPIVAQGANPGNRMAKYLVRRVRERGDEPFDTAWMRDVFDTFYADVGEVSCTFTNLFLEPMTSAGKRLLISGHGSTGQEGATGTPEAISNALCDNFADPRTFTNCMIDTVEANRFLSRTSGRPWIVSFLGGLRRVLRDQLRQKLGLNSSAGYWP
jgi:hypothetical protein